MSLDQGGVSPSKLVVVGEGVDTHYYSPTSRHPPYPLPKPVPPPPSPLKRPFVFLSVFKVRTPHTLRLIMTGNLDRHNTRESHAGLYLCIYIYPSPGPADLCGDV